VVCSSRTRINTDNYRVRATTLRDHTLLKEMRHEHQRSVLASYATVAQNLTDPLEQRRKVAHEETSVTRCPTRSMTTDAVRRAVFDTTELLESILVYLPPKSSFGALRVSRRFRAIIVASVPIQEKMFLMVRNKPQNSWLLKGRREDPHFVEETTQLSGRLLRTPANLNPFLHLRHQDLSGAERAQEELTECVRLSLPKPVTLATLESRTPSTLDTYISDPPSNEVAVTFMYKLPGGHVSGSAYFDNREIRNCTFRDLLGATLDDDDGWAHIRLKGHDCDVGRG
jgi:hypothetical protein